MHGGRAKIAACAFGSLQKIKRFQKQRSPLLPPPDLKLNIFLCSGRKIKNAWWARENCGLRFWKPTENKKLSKAEKSSSATTISMLLSDAVLGSLSSSKK